MTNTETKILQGKYELLDEIGSGGIGVVYKVRHVNLEKFMAVKRFNTLDLLSLAVFKKRWVETTKVSHPNVIVVHDLFEEEGKTYLVMEYMPDGSLREKIKVSGQLSIDESIRIIVHVLSGIKALHSQGIYHRDLKPENILFSGDQVKLSDFDIAHLPEHKFTQIGFQPGTLPYMAPEQIRGEKITEAADLYSAGAIFYEMLTGSHYLGRKLIPDEEEMKRRIFKQPPIPFSEYREDVPEKIDKVIMKALEKSPKERYHSAGEMLSGMENRDKGFYYPEPQMLIHTPEPKFRPPMRGKKNLFRIGLPILITLLIILSILWWTKYRDSSAVDMRPFLKNVHQNILLAYDPIDFNPDEKREPPEASIEKDIRTLWQSGFYGIITFRSKGILGRVPEIAKKNGMKFIIMGIWDPKDEEELKAARGALTHVDGYCVGHNGLEKEYHFEELKQSISALRSHTRKPVTTTQKLADYGSHPELLEIGDWVFPDVHGYWHEGATPEMMAQWTIEAMKKFDQLVGTIKKPIILKMVSFPSGPDGKASEEAQAQFYKQLFRQVKDRTDIPARVKLSFLGAFDPIWKIPEQRWAAGERFTGLFNVERKPKKAVEVFRKSLK